MSCCSMTKTSSTTTCTIHEVGLSGASGCYRVLTQATIYWGKYFIMFELGLCLLSVSDKTFVERFDLF